MKIMLHLFSKTVEIGLQIYEFEFFSFFNTNFKEALKCIQSIIIHSSFAVF